MPAPKRPESVVYGHYYLHQSFAFGEERLMRAYAAEVAQVEGCKTIGQAMALAPELALTYAPGIPDDDEEMEDLGLTAEDDYEARSSGPAEEGDWPPMPTGFGLETFADDDTEAWDLILGPEVGGSVVTTTLNGDYLNIPEDREPQLLAAFAALGVTAVRDDGVIETLGM